MRDFLLVIGPQGGARVQKLGLRLVEEAVVPFDDVEHAQKMVRTLVLALHSMHILGQAKPFRTNVVCGDDVSECLELVYDLSKLGEVVLITSMESVGEMEKLGDQPKLCRVKNVMLLLDSFEEFYRFRSVVKKLRLRTRVTVVSDLESMEDVDLVFTLQKRLGIYGLYLSRRCSVDEVITLGLQRLFVNTSCVVQWMHFDVLPLQEVVDGRRRYGNTFVALPVETTRAMIALSPLGVYRVEGSEAKPIQLSSLSKILGEGDGEITTILRWVKPQVVFKLRGNVIVSEDDVKLLRCIEECKCLRRAMKCTGMNYLAIRKRIEELEQAFGTKIVVSKRGGMEKGFTELTPMGKKVLEIFENLVSMIKSAINDGIGLPIIDDACVWIDFP